MKPMIFDSTDGNSTLYRKMLASGRYDEGPLVRNVYGDGEVGHFLNPRNEVDGAHPSLTPTVSERHVVVVGDWSSNQLIIDMLDLAHTAFDEAAVTVTLVVDRATLPRDRFRRRALLELFAQVPRCNGCVGLADSGNPSAIEYKNVRVPRHPRRCPGGQNTLGGWTRPILLYTSSYDYLACEMAQLGDFDLIDCRTEQLDGRPFFKALPVDVAGRRVIIASGAIDAREIMEQHYMARAAIIGGAAFLERIEGYQQNATMERKTRSGESVKAKIRARQLSALPQTRTRVIFCDLHSEGIPYYLEGDIQPQHTYIGKHLVTAHAREMLALPSTDQLGTLPLLISNAQLQPLTLLATDSGRARWVDSMGLDIGLTTAFGRKVRLGDGNIIFLGALGPVFGRHGLMYDDKCGTGSTALKAGQGVRIDQYGRELLESFGIKFDGDGKIVPESVKPENIDDRRVPAITTEACFSHFVGSAAVVRKMREARDVLGRPLFSRIVAANTTPNAQSLHDGEFFIAKSIAPLLVASLSS